MTKKDGGVSTIPTVRQNWYGHPSGDDVEVIPLDIGASFDWWSFGAEQFITRQIIDAYRIGYGDEAFLVGRLIAHDGRQKNAPVIRFGNISLMADPDEPISCGDGRTQEGFLVECRSLSGFSGSPVFVMTTQTYGYSSIREIDRLPGADIREHGLPGEPTRLPNTLRVTNAGPWLLGIDWGHVPLWKPVYERVPGRPNRETNYRTELNTGIACVLPAWRIADILNDEELVMQRKNGDERIADLQPPFGNVREGEAVPDIAKEDTAEFSQVDFESALRKVSRKITPEK